MTTLLAVLLTASFVVLSWQTAKGLEAWIWGIYAPPRPLAEASRLLTWSWTLLAGFHLLMALGLFRPFPALVLWSVSAFVLRHWRLPEPPPESAAAGKPSWIWASLAVALGLMLGIAFLRGIFLPTYSWDTLTYHLPLAASWVQEGGHSFWAAPGGWAFYQWFTSNGEALVSWTVLGMHGDDLSGLVLFLPWFLTYFSLRGLAISLGLSAFLARLVALVLLTAPCYLQALNTGEVDLTLFAFLIAGAAFSQQVAAGPETHRVPHLLLTAAAWGAAAGTKVMGLPALLVLALWGCLLLVRGKVSGRIFLLTALVGASTWAPWAVRSAWHSGSPLWPAPLTVGERTLWPGEPELAATHHEFDLAAEGIVAKHAEPTRWILYQYFSLGLRNLGPVLLAAIMLGLFGAWGLARSPPRGIGPLVALTLLELVIFFSPKLWSARVVFSYSYGRFLGYPAAILMILGLRGLPTETREGKLFSGTLTLLLAIHLLRTSPFGWYLLESPRSFQVFLLAASLLGGLVLSKVGWERLRRARTSPSQGIAVALLLLLLTPQWRKLRDELRFPAYIAEPALVLRDAIPALQVLDQPDSPKRLAVSAGHGFFGINQLWMPFMGRRLQNTLRYVPITASGEVISYRDIPTVRAQVSPPAWVQRIREGGFTHVVCLPPASVETVLCRDNPEIFEELVGGNMFRVWKVREASSLSPPATRPGAG